MRAWLCGASVGGGLGGIVAEAAGAEGMAIFAALFGVIAIGLAHYGERR